MEASVLCRFVYLLLAHGEPICECPHPQGKTGEKEGWEGRSLFALCCRRKHADQEGDKVKFRAEERDRTDKEVSSGGERSQQSHGIQLEWKGTDTDSREPENEPKDKEVHCWLVEGTSQNGTRGGVHILPDSEVPDLLRVIYVSSGVKLNFK